MFCGNLNGKEIKKKKKKRIYSLCCTAEANTTLSSSYASTEVHVKGELLDVVPAGGPDVQPFGSRLQGPALT